MDSNNYNDFSQEADIENDGGRGGRGGVGVGVGVVDERNESNVSSYIQREAPLTEVLLKSRVNNTSQIAIIGANVCPIESLDYEYEFNFITLQLFLYDSLWAFRISDPF